MNRPLPAQSGDSPTSIAAPVLLLDLDAFELNLALTADASKTRESCDAFEWGALW